jgi:hypothetical protein
MPLGFPYRGTFFRTVFYHWHYGAFAGVAVVFAVIGNIPTVEH